MDYVFFEWWNAKSYIAFWASFWALFFIAIVNEFLYFYHLGYLNKDERKQSSPSSSTSKFQKSLATATIYTIRAYVSYFLMMVFMTFNGFFMTSIIAGFFTGHLIFSLLGSEKKTDSTVHPPCPCC